MGKSRKTNPDFLNGVPELLILQLLSLRPMYGYELVQEISTQTADAFRFGEGSIYPILHRLEAEGSLVSRTDRVNGRRRVVYKTTPSGKTKLNATVSKWKNVVDAVNSVIQGDSHGQENAMA